jgi:gluconolactonase
MTTYQPAKRLLTLFLFTMTMAIMFASCNAPKEADKPATDSKPAATEKKSDSKNEVKIVRLDPKLDSLIPKEAKVEQLADGYKWTEGPVWNKKGSYLLFSDIPNNAIVKWQEGKGAATFLTPSGYTGKEPFTGKEPGTNGLTFDAQGRLVACAHGDRQIVRLEDDGKKRVTLTDKIDGKRFNSPNDLVYKSNGDLYFTDPIYGLPGQDKDPKRELDYCGVFRLDTKGKVTLLTKEITRPNGIAFSPDEKILYVASSDPDKAIWMAYDVKSDGTLEKDRIFFDATAWAKEKKPGLPDGMKMDKSGNLWATGPGGVHIFSPDGKHLGTIDTGVPTANVAWGNDGSTLYITANTALLRLKTSTKGTGF